MTTKKKKMPKNGQNAVSVSLLVQRAIIGFWVFFPMLALHPITGGSVGPPVSFLVGSAVVSRY
jgi:hypothetical protein